MQMRHGLARIRAVVEHQPKSILRETELLRDFCCFDHQVTEHLVIIGVRFSNARDWFLRNDQNVDRRLRFYVVESNDLVVLVNDFCGDFARDDFLE